ncbi:MAG: DNA-binding response regulator, partial [Spirochaetaceae bacterium]
ARNGKTGLQAATDGDHDLVLLDLMLPGIDGFDVAAALRDRVEIPILIVSARHDDEDKIRGLGLGADDYITKPFSPSELVARVKTNIERYRRLTSRHRSSPVAGAEGSLPVDAARELAAGPVTIDLASLRVACRGREVVLTAKELAILRLLMENPDTVLTKDDIYGRVWGEAHFGDMSTVTVHIRRLREKLEEDPGRPTLIETVWGLGYRFNAT